MAWSRVTQEEINVKYTCPVSKDIKALRKTYGISSDSCLLRRMDIDRFINDLIRILLRRSGGLPKVKFKKCLKPYWSNQLKEDRILVKNLRREWDSAGRPRSHNSDIFSRYKEAKKVYRDNIRKAERDYEVKWANDVIISCEYDHKVFWWMINKRRKSRSSLKVSPICTDQGLKVKVADLVCAWADHFEELATPSVNQSVR